MLEAILASKRSPDPNTQVGSCIVTPNNRIVASGYNSFPNGISTRAFSWARKGDALDCKYFYVVHAEKNAIHNATGSVEGCTVYVTMYPCNECAKDIIQSGITKVVYLTDPYQDQPWRIAAERMFDQIDIPTEQHVWSKNIHRILEEICTTVK